MVAWQTLLILLLVSVHLPATQSFFATKITLEIGRVKNLNKNPVTERAIEELCLELLNLSPWGRIFVWHHSCMSNSKHKLIKYFFVLDLLNYARLMPVHLMQMKALERE